MKEHKLWLHIRKRLTMVLHGLTNVKTGAPGRMWNECKKHVNTFVN